MCGVACCQDGVKHSLSLSGRTHTGQVSGPVLHHRGIICVFLLVAVGVAARAPLSLSSAQGGKFISGPLFYVRGVCAKA